MPKLPEQTDSFQRMPAGNHLAVCYEVLDLGTQEKTYEGQTRHVHQIWIGWETPMEKMEDGRPFVIGQRFTYSSNERSNLMKTLESWRGKPFSAEDFGKFEIGNVIGKGCFLNVVHVERGDRVYANIEAVAALPKGTETPKLINEPLLIDLDETLTQEKFDKLSDFMKATIMKSPEWEALQRNGKMKVKEPEIKYEADDNCPF